MKLVLIEWIDTHSSAGWQTLDEIRDYSKPLQCTSVGWEVDRNREVVSIVQSVCGKKNGWREKGSESLVIPKKCITRETVLRK